MTALADIGTHGAFQGNAHRDLQRMLNQGPLDLYIPPPWHVKLPLLDVRKRPPAKIQQDYPIMMPHELLVAMWSRNRSEFNGFILGRAGQT